MKHQFHSKLKYVFFLVFAFFSRCVIYGLIWLIFLLVYLSVFPSSSKRFQMQMPGREGMREVRVVADRLRIDFTVTGVYGPPKFLRFHNGVGVIYNGRCLAYTIE